jgi:hypothetical protein
MPASTGPTTYPGADLTTRHWPRGGGIVQPALTKLVLHSTETAAGGVPRYNDGKSAPTLTVDPWNRKVYQHFRSVAVSAKALLDNNGFAGNRDNVAQIEIIGYSDPVDGKKFGSFLRDLGRAEIEFVAGVVAWFCREWGTPAKLTTKPWPMHPASFGINSPARMTEREWDDFQGILGHLHVPQNKHGDPSLDIAALMDAVRRILDLPASPGGSPFGQPQEEIGPLVLEEADTAWFDLGIANMQDPRFGGSSAFADRGEFLRDVMPASVYALSETNQRMRKDICTVLGPAWKLWTRESGPVCVMFDSSVFDYRLPRSVEFGTSYGHGAVAVPLIHRASRLGVDVIAVHVRPKAVATLADKKADVKKSAALAGTWPAVLAGDFSLNAERHLPAGWKRASLDINTMNIAGEQHVDAAYTKGSVSGASSKLHDPGDLSDHKWVTTSITVTDNGRNRVPE